MIYSFGRLPPLLIYVPRYISSKAASVYQSKKYIHYVPILAKCYAYLYLIITIYEYAYFK